MQILNQLICIFLALILYIIVYKQIIKPLVSLRFYRKQGIQCQFVPLTGSSRKDSVNVLTQGDYYHDWINKSLGTKGNYKREKMFCKSVGSTCALIVTDPKIVLQMFTNKQVFIKHKFQNALIKRLSPYGLVLLQQAMWKKHRKLISKGFQYNRIDSLLQQVNIISKNFINKITKQQKQIIPNVFNFFKQAAGNIISLVYFQEDIASLQIQNKSLPVFLSDLIADLANQSYSWRYCIFGMLGVDLHIFSEQRRLLKNIQTIRQAVRKIVRKHKQIRKNINKQAANFSMWDHFFCENDSKSIFSQNQIIDQFITFFSDGIYTTGHFLMMLTYNLAKNPKWKQLLKSQFKEKLTDVQVPTQSLINSLPIYNACMKQSLRLVPPVVTGIQRVATKDTIFSDGTMVKKDTMVFACHLVNHLDPNFHDNPQSFDPQRWLNPQSKTLKSVKQHPAIFIPFSIGERHCPGQKFAMAQSAIFLSKFLTQFDYFIQNEEQYNLKYTQRFLRQPLEQFSYRIKPINNF